MPFSNDCLDLIGTPLNRLKVITVGQNCEERVALQLIGPMDSVVIDLTMFGLGPHPSSSSSNSGESSSAVPSTGNANPDGSIKNGVEIILKETSKSSTHFSVDSTIDSEADGQAGIVRFHVTRKLTEFAGIFLGMALVWEKGILRKQYPFYFEVTPNLAHYNASGPITIFELRMAMRDISPDSNFLLDSVEFSNEELAWALARPIEYWNEALPPVSIHTPQSFPYRYHWVNAAIAELLIMAALWMRRNDLDYSAAGLSIMDTKKWPDYYKIGMEKKKEWQEWVTAKKVSINVYGGFGTLPGYSYPLYR